MTGALSISSELRAHKVHWRVFPEITVHTSSLSSTLEGTEVQAAWNKSFFEWAEESTLSQKEIEP